MIAAQPIAMSPIGTEDDEVFYLALSRLSAVASAATFKTRADYVQPGGVIQWDDDTVIQWDDGTDIEWD